MCNSDTEANSSFFSVFYTRISMTKPKASQRGSTRILLIRLKLRSHDSRTPAIPIMRKIRVNSGQCHGTAAGGRNDDGGNAASLFRHRSESGPQYNRRTTRRNLHCAGCLTKWHSLCNGNQTFYRGMEVAVTFPYTKCMAVLRPNNWEPLFEFLRLQNGKLPS